MCGISGLFDTQGRRSFDPTLAQRISDVRGTRHNLSANGGTDGPTDQPAVLRRRGLWRRALLATLFCAQGTPQLLAGDEIGHSQRGNNNAYCQDNDTTWLDWAQGDQALFACVRRLLADLLEGCTEQPVLKPAGCPFGLAVDDRVTAGPQWTITDLETLCNRNRIFVDRLQGVGAMLQVDLELPRRVFGHRAVAVIHTALACDTHRPAALDVVQVAAHGVGQRGDAHRARRVEGVPPGRAPGGFAGQAAIHQPAHALARADGAQPQHRRGR